MASLPAASSGEAIDHAHYATAGAAARSGASLCALAPQHLCLFGGRDSISGDTLGATRLVSVRSGVAVWDVLTSKTHPPARCYHTASLWPTARGSRQGSGVCLSMVVFGGAGDGDGEGNDLTGT